ncbi:MAG: hypothetical protein RTS72_06510 [Candidatus Thorarchaeota archaeon]
MASFLRRTKSLPIVFQLGETTWKVFMVLLSIRRSIGPRELSKRLNLSSPSVGLYHLNKLTEQNLTLKTTDGDYIVNPDADLGFLENYLFFEHGAIPRITFYASFVTGLLIIYLLTTPFDFGAHNVFALAIGMSASAFLWMEVSRHYNAMAK